MLCEIGHRSVWSYSYVPILLAREYKPCRFARTCKYHPQGPGDAATRMVMCGLFWVSNRNHYYLLLVLVIHASAC